MKKTFVLALGLVSIFLMAHKPVNVSSADQYARMGFSGSSKGQYIPAAGAFVGTSSQAVSTAATAEGNRPRLFEFGTMNVIKCEGDARGYWVSDVGITVTSTNGFITDSGSTSGRTFGNGGSFSLEANVGRHVATPYPWNTYTDLDSPISQRTSGCTDSGSSTTTAEIGGYPCDAVADCFYASAECSASVKPKGFLLFLDPEAAGQCNVDREK